jgi:hypothetical protein
MGCAPDGQMSDEEYESYINGYSKHRFNFNTPENWDSLSAKEQAEWGKTHGYIVIEYLDGETERYKIYNEYLLTEFLENAGEEKELLILKRYYYKNYLAQGEKDTTYLDGVYYDGESYYTLPPHEFSNPDEYFLQKYKKCGIKTDDDTGLIYIYVANDFTLTIKNEMNYYTHSFAYADDSDFYKKYQTVAHIGKAAQD